MTNGFFVSLVDAPSVFTSTFDSMAVCVSVLPSSAATTARANRENISTKRIQYTKYPVPRLLDISLHIPLASPAIIIE